MDPSRSDHRPGPVDFVCGDEVYGSCPELRDYLEEQGQAYVLRVPSTFRITLARGVTLTCALAVRRLCADRRRWEIRSARKGSKGERWYAWACIATASPRHCLLIRRHIRTGELALPLLPCPRRPAGRHDPPHPRDSAATGTVTMQARVDASFASELLELDAPILGLLGASALVREGLRLVHKRARELAVAAEYDKFYGGQPAPSPDGVSVMPADAG